MLLANTYNGMTMMTGLGMGMRSLDVFAVVKLSPCTSW